MSYNVFICPEAGQSKVVKNRGARIKISASNSISLLFIILMKLDKFLNPLKLHSSQVT